MSTKAADRPTEPAEFLPLPRDATDASSTGMFRIPSYAVLLNQRMIVPSTTTSYFAVEQHFFFNCMRYLIQAIHVDSDWYLSRYADVRSAIEKGLVKNPTDHYARFGYYEHRLPYEIKTNASWYLDTYADVDDAIKRRQFTSAEEHFELVGFKEGRLPFPDFRLRLADIA